MLQLMYCNLDPVTVAVLTALNFLQQALGLTLF